MEQVNTVENQGSMGGSAKRHRSPAYPAIDLAEALQRAELLRKDYGRNAVHVDMALSKWGLKPKGGTGMAMLSALIKYGLLDDEGTGGTRRVRLTPFALGILLDDRPDSEERIAALKTAALTPSIYKELWDRYQGAIPADGTLRVYLRRDRGFGDEAAEDVIEGFRKTLAYAKLTESDNMSPEEEDKHSSEGDLQMAPPPVITSDETPSKPSGQASTIQQSTKTVQIPLTGAPWAMLQVPYPMSDENWEEMEKYLEFLNLNF